MTVGVPTCKYDTIASDIARFLLEHHVEAMCVLDAEGHGIGVVGEEEVVAALQIVIFGNLFGISLGILTCYMAGGS